MKVQIEALLLQTVELPDTKPSTLKKAVEDLCAEHTLDACEFTARWLPIGHQRQTVKTIC